MSDALDDLHAALAEHGARVSLRPDGEGLRLEFDDGAPEPPEELLEVIRAHRAEIVELLRSAAPIAEAAPTILQDDPPPPEPAIVVVIGGKRQHLAPAEIIVGEHDEPERPRAVPISETEPSDMEPEEREKWLAERNRFAKRAQERGSTPHQEAALFDAKLAFGDPRAWAIFYRNARGF